MGEENGRHNARRYLVGLTASLLGNSAMSLVAGIWVKSLTGSTGAAALVSAFAYAPSVCGPLAGVLADGVRRRPYLVAVNLAAAVVLLPLLFVRSAGQVWVIYAVMVGYGVSAVLIDPAESALFAIMLPTDIRRRANGTRLAIQESGKLVAPLLGAGLFVALGGGAVAALDAATFVFAAIMLTRLRLTEPAPARTESHWRAELAAGLRRLRRVPELRVVVTAGALAMLVSGLDNGAIYALVDALHWPPGFLGPLTGVLGAGSIVAGLTSARLIAWGGERRLAVLGLCNGTIGLALLATGWLPLALLGFLALGFALPWTVSAVINRTQRGTPAELQGRVAAAVTLLLFAPLPLTQAVGAAIIGPLGFRFVYLATALADLATAVWLGVGLSRRPGPAR